MKRFLVLSAIVAALVVPVASFALIAGTMHDFSGGPMPAPNNARTGWDEICVPCHTPHNALQSNPVPLWNHLTSVQVFTPYGNPAGTMQSVAGAPSGVSLKCLSCHDGATNIDGYQNSQNGLVGSMVMPAGPTNFGTDLSNDHPISISYAAAVAGGDLELQPIAGVQALGMLFAPGNAMVECSSCHDVHGTVGPGVALLRMSNAASALCLTCHNK